jgi:hypothetical protein
MEPHAHHNHGEEPPLEAPEAFQMLSWFLSDPTPQAADELRSYLPDIRSIAFYYRFLLDSADLSDAQLGLVRQFMAQTYAAQQVLHRYAHD